MEHKIKLFVDDIRNAPTDDWVVARTVTEAIRTIANFKIEEISLDHDISHQVSIGNVSRPYPCDECFCSVAHFIGATYRNLASIGGQKLPKITLHTANPVGAEKMKNILKDYDLESEIIKSDISNRLEMEE